MPPSSGETSNNIYNEELNKVFAQDMPDAVTFVDIILREGVRLQASDIFLEPQTNHLTARFRIDGVIYQLGDISMNAFDSISSRIKVLSNLDPTEHRRIQEGQFSIEQEGNIINFRVEIAQTINGEMIVIRVLERKSMLIELSQLGMNEVAYQTYKMMLKQSGGLILVCGPTGCGKTTTLYSTTHELNRNRNFNVMTIEDPVEYQLEGVNQMQTQESSGFTFAVGLKTILRLSPDIILVGEIRDRETASIAIESGLTGHMVLSTLHASDSVGALLRILDLEIEPYILNSALIGIVAQRLIRRVCQKCKEAYTPSQDELDLFLKVIGRAPKQLFKGKGCSECQNLAYKGRTGIFEILPMDTKIRNLIREKASEDQLRTVYTKESFTSLMKSGFEKCEQGITTIDEVVRNSYSAVY